jgi:hypothetical protein
VVQLQCVAALVLGVAVLLSALFWLPPFAGRGGGKEGPDPGDEFGGERSPPHCEISGSVRPWSPSGGCMLDLRLLCAGSSLVDARLWIWMSAVNSCGFGMEI